MLWLVALFFEKNFWQQLPMADDHVISVSTLYRLFTLELVEVAMGPNPSRRRLPHRRKCASAARSSQNFARFSGGEA